MELSVVIPTYNRAGLIGETLDAVLGQTTPADEVIVVDDGSTDQTQAVLAGYGGRVCAIRIGNSGDLVARNIGLRAAQGHLVAFCDSDDLWTPGFLATMAAQWWAEPGLTASYADFRVLQDGTLSERTKFEDAPTGYWTGLQATGPDGGVFHEPIVERLLEFQPFFPSSMMVSRAAFLDAGGWDEGVSRIVGCDFATALRVAALPPVAVVRQPLAIIRKHAGNISGDTVAMNLGDARVLEYVLRSRPNLAPFAATIRTSIARRRQEALDSAFSRRDFPAVRDIYRLLPPKFQHGRSRAKRIIAGLPPPLGVLAQTLVSR